MIITILGAASMLFVAAFTWRAYTKQDGDELARREAIIEAWVNIIIGFSANFAANLLLIPLMTNGSAITAADNFFGGWVYTAISIVRQYAIRRWFHTRLEVFKKHAAKLIGKFL